MSKGAINIPVKPVDHPKRCARRPVRAVRALLLDCSRGILYRVRLRHLWQILGFLTHDLDMGIPWRPSVRHQR